MRKLPPLAQIRKQQADAKQERAAQIKRGVAYLRDAEYDLGWIGVMCIIEGWFCQPLRGRFS